MITFEKRTFDCAFVESLLRISSKHRIVENIRWEALDDAVLFFAFVNSRFGAGKPLGNAICVYDLPLLEQCLLDSSRFGIELFIYRKFGSKPEDVFFDQFTDEEKAHFNGCETYIDPMTAKPFQKQSELCNTP